MSKEGLTTRPWYRWCPRDFYADPNVIAMTREQRWSYRDALDFSWMQDTPAGVAVEAVWMARLGYDGEAWKLVRGIYVKAFEVSDGVWTQKRLLAEYEHAIWKSVKAVSAVRKRWDERDTSVYRRNASVIQSKIEPREKQREPRVKVSCPEPQKAAPPGQPFLPLIDGSLWTPKGETVAHWRAAYPAVDVDAHLLRMRAWLESNPTKRKTARGIERFASNWLAREQDSGKPSAASTPTGEAAISAWLAENGDETA